MNSKNDTSKNQKDDQSISLELKLLIFFMFYAALLLVLSQFFIRLSCSQSGCLLEITNWYILFGFIAMGFIRIFWYFHQKGRLIQREKGQRKVEGKIESTQETFKDEKVGKF